MPWQVFEREELARQIDEVVTDTNRSFSKKNQGYGYVRVTAIVVEELRYDEDKDDMVATEQIARRRFEYRDQYHSTATGGWF